VTFGHEIRSRMWPQFRRSRCRFFGRHVTYITLRLLMAFFRGGYIGLARRVLCVVACRFGAVSTSSAGSI